MAFTVEVYASQHRMLGLWHVGLSTIIWLQTITPARSCRFVQARWSTMRVYLLLRFYLHFLWSYMRSSAYLISLLVFNAKNLNLVTRELVILTACLPIDFLPAGKCNMRVHSDDDVSYIENHPRRPSFNHSPISSLQAKPVSHSLLTSQPCSPHVAPRHPHIAPSSGRPRTKLTA